VQVLFEDGGSGADVDAIDVGDAVHQADEDEDDGGRGETCWMRCGFRCHGDWTGGSSGAKGCALRKAAPLESEGCGTSAPTFNHGARMIYVAGVT
jgi:hypothetical protein